MGRRMGIEHAEIAKAPKDPVVHVPRTAVTAMAGDGGGKTTLLGAAENPITRNRIILRLN